MFPNRDQTRPRGRHRKPRRPGTGRLIRGGLLTGVVGSVAVTGTTTAVAAELPELADLHGPSPDGDGPGGTTVEGLDSVIAHSTAQAAVATQDYATDAGARQARETAEQRAIEDARREASERREQEERHEREARRVAAAAAAEEAAEARRQAEAEAEAEQGSRATAPAPTAGTDGAGGGAGSGASAVVSYVLGQLGDGYAMGSAGPDAWDCSGLVQAAYASVGVDLPRTAAEQSLAGTQVSLDALLPGDVLYWGGAGSAYHVAIYVGDGTFVGAQNSSTGVAERTLDWDPPTGAIRLL